MNQGFANRRQDVDFPRPPPTPRNLFGRQDDHHCPYCSKVYRTSTWLENHIKIKHITATTQGHSELLAHMSNNNQNSARNAMLLSQSFQESRWPTVTQDLATTVALLKQLVPLMEGLLPILEQLDGVSLCTPSMGRGNLRAPKRCASSPDLRGEQGAKLRELDSSIHGVRTVGNQNEPENWLSGTTSHTRTSMSCVGSHGTRYTGSTTALSEGSHFKPDSPRYIKRHPCFEQAQGPEEALSHSSTPYSQASNHKVPQRPHRLRPSQTQRSHIQPENTTPVPHEFLRGYPPPSSFSERIADQHAYLSDWLNPDEPLLGNMQPEPNAQLPYSAEDPHQDVGQHQSIFQELQKYPCSTHQQTTEYILGDHHDDIFHYWNSSPTLRPASAMPAARPAETMSRGYYHAHLGNSISGNFPTNSEPGSC